MNKQTFKNIRIKLAQNSIAFGSNERAKWVIPSEQNDCPINYFIHKLRMTDLELYLEYYWIQQKKIQKLHYKEWPKRMGEASKVPIIYFVHKPYRMNLEN